MTHTPTEAEVEAARQALESEHASIVKDYGSGNCPIEIAYDRLARAALQAAYAVRERENLCTSPERVKEADIVRASTDFGAVDCAGTALDLIRS